MAELIGFILTMGIYFWLCSFGNKPKNNQKFGDGKSRYDFQDYVNNKVDKYNK